MDAKDVAFQDAGMVLFRVRILTPQVIKRRVGAEPVSDLCL